MEEFTFEITGVLYLCVFKLGKDENDGDEVDDD